jgi:hypothetical protein
VQQLHSGDDVPADHVDSDPVEVYLLADFTYGAHMLFDVAIDKLETLLNAVHKAKAIAEGRA